MLINDYSYLTADQKSFMHTLATAAVFAEEHYDVPAGVSLSVALVTSNFGHSLPPGSFNPFHIEQPPQFEPSVTFEVKKLVKGKLVGVGMRFRKYASYQDAFDDFCRKIHEQGNFTMSTEEEDIACLASVVQAIAHAKKEYKMRVMAGTLQAPAKIAMPNKGDEPEPEEYIYSGHTVDDTDTDYTSGDTLPDGEDEDVVTTTAPKPRSTRKK